MANDGRYGIPGWHPAHGTCLSEPKTVSSKLHLSVTSPELFRWSARFSQSKAIA
jgi:hypothetical protein